MKYKLLEDGSIEKTEFADVYNKEDFLVPLKTAEKKLIELTAQKRIYDAKVENISRNHPYVLDIEDEKKNAIWLYQENFVASIQVAEMIRELNERMGAIKGEMLDIEAQTGIKFFEEEVKKEEVKE